MIRIMIPIMIGIKQHIIPPWRDNVLNRYMD